MPLSSKQVACDCPAEFIFDILDTLPGSVEMAACTMCGRADLAEPMISEPRPHDVQFHGFLLHDLSDEARAWASAWPRYATVGQTRIYLPATVRFQSVEQRDSLVTASVGYQSGGTLRDKLISLGIPQNPPPPSLPHLLNGFVEIWNGLQLNDSTPLAELLDAATRFNGPNDLARDVLARRKDLHQLAVALLSHADGDQRGHGRYLVQQFRLSGEDILAPIRVRLGTLNDDKTGEIERICSLFWEMKAAAAPALPDLEAAAVRVASTDYYAGVNLTRVIGLLKNL